MALDFISKQNEKLAREIETLPVPKGLNKAQKQEYRKLLAAQSAPYHANGKRYSEKLADIWDDSDAIDSIIVDLSNARPSVRKLLADEIRLLTKAAPTKTRNQLISAINEKKQAVSQEKVMDARNNVKENPFNVSDIEKLKAIEEKAGRDTWVAYLDARVNQLQNEKSGVVQ